MADGVLLVVDAAGSTTPNTVCPEKNHWNTISKLSSLLIKLTARRQTEEVLRETEELFYGSRVWIII